MITEKENSKLHKIIDKFYETIYKFIHWICVKFDITEEDNLIRDFQRKTNTFLNPKKQMKREEMEKMGFRTVKIDREWFPAYHTKIKSVVTYECFCEYLM